MCNPNLVSILFHDQPFSSFEFDDVMPTSRMETVWRVINFRRCCGKISLDIAWRWYEE